MVISCNLIEKYNETRYKLQNFRNRTISETFKDNNTYLDVIFICRVQVVQISPARIVLYVRICMSLR